MPDIVRREGRKLLQASFLISILILSSTCSRQVESKDPEGSLPSLPTPVVMDELSSSPSEEASSILNAHSLVSSALPYHLWVDASNGDDRNTGLTQDQAFRTIQRSADVARPGTVVHILPGVYRESVQPAQSGLQEYPIVYRAEAGAGTVKLRGSELASGVGWTRLTGNEIGLPAGVDPSQIYYAELSGWRPSEAPRFVVRLDTNGEVTERLEPAREPEWQVETEWKAHEFWWTANGGSTVPTCDPATDDDPHCDRSSRSTFELTDNSSDSAPVGIMPGNLTTLGDLTGATIVALDGRHGHYLYRRVITAHDVSAGRVTVDTPCDDDGQGGLGWGSKYYIENHPALLDQPGEWWYDSTSKRLYLWPPEGRNPADSGIEISRHTNGFDLTDRSHVTIEGLVIEFYNDVAYRIDNEGSWLRAIGNSIRSSTLRYADYGILLYQYVGGEAPADYAVDGFLLEDSEVAYMDTSAIESGFWWSDAPDPTQFSHAGVRNTLIRRNEFHHLGFRSEQRSAVGLRFHFPDRLRLEGNHVYNVAQNGAHLFRSVIDSPKQYDYAPDEILLGDILVWGNLFEQTCQLTSDCGAFKMGGNDRPHTHVFRDVLVAGNIFRDTVAWSYSLELRYGPRLRNGHGFYLDRSSGIHAYRNIAYNNTGSGFKLNCLWRDGDIVYYNNIAANNSTGFQLTDDDMSCDNHMGSVNTQLVSNIMVNNDSVGIDFGAAYEDDTYGNLTIDRNLYYGNGWDEGADIRLLQGDLPTQYFYGLSDIQARTQWEDYGVEGDPGFLAYDLTDHDRYDESWPDFHVTLASNNVVDRGTVELPASLDGLLQEFSVYDGRFQTAFEIGRYEAPGVRMSPGTTIIRPGGAAQFTMSAHPSNFPLPLTLTVLCPGPDLICEPASDRLEPGAFVPLTVTDRHDPAAEIQPPVPYTISVYAGFDSREQKSLAILMIGGQRLYLPLLIKTRP